MIWSYFEWYFVLYRRDGFLLVIDYNTGQFLDRVALGSKCWFYNAPKSRSYSRQPLYIRNFSQALIRDFSKSKILDLNFLFFSRSFDLTSFQKLWDSRNSPGLQDSFFDLVKNIYSAFSNLSNFHDNKNL